MEVKGKQQGKKEEERNDVIMKNCDKMEINY